MLEIDRLTPSEVSAKAARYFAWVVGKAQCSSDGYCNPRIVEGGTRPQSKYSTLDVQPGWRSKSVELAAATRQAISSIGRHAPTNGEVALDRHMVRARLKGYVRHLSITRPPALQSGCSGEPTSPTAHVALVDGAGGQRFRRHRKGISL